MRAWKARAVAKATRHLSVTAAGSVDRAVADAILAQAWGPFTDYLAAKIYEADPRAAEYEHAARAAARYVSTGRSNAHGLKTLIARANAGDVIWFLAMTNRIADLLAVEGDRDTADMRRSKAIGILAQPVVALDLLTRHHDDPDDPSRPVEPADPADPADPGTPPDQGAGHTSVRVDPFDPRVRSLDPAKLARRSRCICICRLRPCSPATGWSGWKRSARCSSPGCGPCSASRPRSGCSRCSTPPTTTPVNAYEIPTLMRERVRLRNPVDIFPWATTPARGCDLDHTRAFLDPARGGPPGQTGPANLGPLSRTHHRTKTFTRWRVRQAEPGVYVWRSPNGWIYLVNPRGTHPLGNTPFAHAVWHAAQRQDAYVAAS